MSPPPPPAIALPADDLLAPMEVAPPRRSSKLSVLRRMAAFSGPGYLVAVGYMDPGNWATGIAAGSAFGYRLLFVVVAANLMALLLQTLAVRLGVVTGLDLAQACRARYGPATRMFLWLICEAAIIACDMAEVIGAAVALNLLFKIPLVIGVGLTGLQVLLVLALQGRGLRRLEALIISLMAVITLCFGFELLLARPAAGAMLRGLVPSADIISNPGMLYLAIGIMGATVMPHNLYLHSAIVKSRGAPTTEAGKREAIGFATIDTAAALTLAVFVNAAILVLAAASFHGHGLTGVAELQDAYRLLAPTLGAAAASTVFAVALLASGQNSAVTGTMAGQIVMEGFTDLRWPTWARRLVSRLLAMLPAMAAVAWSGEAGATRLLIFSQVVLSLQLPFAVFPLVQLTSSRRWMGAFANSLLVKIAAWSVALLIVALNAMLILQAL
jgi:manganese transport protein